jgi:membrane peptidoglycan carboxypeptidase
MQIVCAIGCLFLLLILTVAIILMRTAYRLLNEKPPRRFYETVKKRPMFVPLKTLPPEVVKIFLLSEDPTFYQHHGILPTVMIQAVIRTIITKERRGGSTITQQLVKNIYLTHEQTIRRKALESLIALYIEWRGLLSKDEILELYLNLAEMGPRVYGIGAAAEYHFAKSAARLTVNQAIILATIMPSPFWRRPVKAPSYFESMRNRKILKLVARKFLTVAQAKEILQQYTAERGFDPELRTEEELSHKKNGSSHG